MKVISMVEHEDGSATVELDMTNEEKMLVVQVGLVQVLRDSIAATEAKNLTSRQQ